MMAIMLGMLLLFSDTIDKLENGKITDQSQCLLCGGRLLCGATDETLSLEIFNEKQTANLKNICFEKNYSYLKKIKKMDQLPWVSEELKSFSHLKSYLVKIVDLKSKSTFTNKRVEGISDEQIQSRIQYRLRNGVPFSDLKKVVEKKEIETLMAANKILPLFSREHFQSKISKSSTRYHNYLEDLIAAPLHLMGKMESGYVYTMDPSSRGIASLKPASRDKIGEKPHDFFTASDISSFLKKLLYYPKEFCEKMGYKKIKHANRVSLIKLAKSYGGASTVEKNFYYKKLVDKFKEVEMAKKEACKEKMQSFLNDGLLNLPNPGLAKKIVEIKEKNSRFPSSTEKNGNCKFNINNYQEECD